jgi:molybdate transport system ATP-binding protein
MVTAAHIALDRVGIALGEFRLEEISLQATAGEYTVLTGPNGAGKTILLKMIAGLLAPTEGDIRISGRSVLRTPPWRRSIGYVPQDGALFPNRTVAQNIAFGLEVRKTPRATRIERVSETAELLGVTHLLDRKVQALSGGERQKVAIGRAIIVAPSVLLLDEPVSAIDEDARDGLCRELHRIQRETMITTIHVSHNRTETQLVADRVATLRDGKITVTS